MRQEDQESLTDEVMGAWEDLSPIKQERIQAIRDLKRKGATTAMIAKLLSISDRTVQSDLRWMRKNFGAIADRFTQAEFVGESISFYQEVENKAMSMFEESSQQSESEVLVNGKMVVLKVPPDHGSSSRYLQAALQARDRLCALVREIGMLNVVPMKIEVDGRIDVSQLRGEALERAGEEIEAKIIALRSRYDRIANGSAIT